MHNHYHPHITRSQIFCSHCLIAECTVIWRRLSRKALFKELATRLKAITAFCLTTMAVGTIVLSGVYLFLVQLANHGW